MEPARDGQEDPGDAEAVAADDLAAMEPARDGQEDPGEAVGHGYGDAAAMEPARDGREDGAPHAKSWSTRTGRNGARP